MPENLLLKPDIDFIRQVKSSGGETLKKCYQCATCSVVCNLSSKDHPFPRKQMMLAQWGMKDQLLADPSLWLCHQCNDCTTRCPRDARPGDALAALRAISFKEYAFPKFMGGALSNPGSLALLFLVPALVLLGILFKGSGSDLGYLFQMSGEVDYARAFPHGILEMLFIGGNILIFAFAAVGLLRFWNHLKSNHSKSPGSGFISALISTGMEIAFHKKFSSCEANKSRQWGHLLLFYGTAGSAITAGLALFFTIIMVKLGSPLAMAPPLDLPNPIKLLGVVSGLGMFIGGWILISRRRRQLDGVGKSNYIDWLFLIVIFSVGLTGMFSYTIRAFLPVPVIGYLIYYVHLILVFFLLWYAPYSKFAHMFYRTLALVYAKSTGWDKPRKTSPN
ncbi:MAG: quinone-interacting membrane-bound oxidoreductase complex subunit QmoC [bacterium]|nr:quinone-interacting membrane-bound oxidoreductase complex subunit QmoC [bacterium]